MITYTQEEWNKAIDNTIELHKKVKELEGELRRIACYPIPAKESELLDGMLEMQNIANQSLKP